MTFLQREKKIPDPDRPLNKIGSRTEPIRQTSSLRKLTQLKMKAFLLVVALAMGTVEAQSLAGYVPTTDVTANVSSSPSVTFCVRDYRTGFSFFVFRLSLIRVPLTWTNNPLKICWRCRRKTPFNRLQRSMRSAFEP